MGGGLESGRSASQNMEIGVVRVQRLVYGSRGQDLGLGRRGWVLRLRDLGAYLDRIMENQMMGLCRYVHVYRICKCGAHLGRTRYWDTLCYIGLGCRASGFGLGFRLWGLGLHLAVKVLEFLGRGGLKLEI